MLSPLPCPALPVPPIPPLFPPSPSPSPGSTNLRTPLLTIVNHRHSAGTYDAETDTGGSNGAGMRYEAEGGDPSNAGLQHARLFLEPVKRQHPWITYADLWTLAGVTAIEAMGGPSIPWLPGRTDFVDDSKLPPRGRLPDAAQGADHVRHVFYRMGFTDDRDLVALCGAHNLGRCHAANSGFEGKWVNNPTRFSNQYFKLLISEPWEEKVLPSGIKQFAAVDPVTEEELMMLPTDMALVADPEFKKYVELYAKDKDVFFQDFSRAFARLMELGIKRDEEGHVTNTDNEKGGYVSAPLKADVVGRPGEVEGSGQVGKEAEPLARQNEKYRERARL